MKILNVTYLQIKQNKLSIALEKLVYDKKKYEKRTQSSAVRAIKIN